MPIDPTSLDAGTPKTRDGRQYPDHLKAYEAYDGTILGTLEDLGEASMNEVAAMISDPKLRAVAPRCLASAEWRGLIERCDRGMASRRTYVLTARGIERLTDLGE